MDFNAEIVKIKELLDKAQEILVLIHENPNFDSVGSALAIYLGLVNMGKKVTVASPDVMTVELSNFVGVNKIITDIAKKNFVISLDYVDGSIEKVSYNIEGNKFNLVVEHRSGFEPFSADKVNYSYTGTGFDLIITVDTIHLGGLKKLYESQKDLFASKPIINIDRHPNNAHFGQINLVDPRACSTAELVAQFLSSENVKLTSDIATNLLNAVYGATNSFQSYVSPVAFEVAAVCLKAGGKRFTKAQGAEEVPHSESITRLPKVPEEKSKFIPKVSQADEPRAVVQKAASAAQTPADWLKPKIFRSSDRGINSSL